MVSMSVVLMVSFPVLVAYHADNVYEKWENQRKQVRPTPVRLLSIWISTTSPSMISVSSFMRTPILRRKAWVKASVFDIEREKTSLPAIIVNGTSSPSCLAIPEVKSIYSWIMHQ